MKRRVPARHRGTMGDPDAWHHTTDNTGETLEDEVEDDDLYELARLYPLPALSGIKSRPPNACTQCGLEKKSRESGHTKLGWCPEMQSYTLRASKDKDKDKKSCGQRLRDLLRDPLLEKDAGARAFLHAVRMSDHEAVQRALNGACQRKRKAPADALSDEDGTSEPRPELLLMLVGRDLHRWKWSIFSEAVRVLPNTEAELTAHEAGTSAMIRTLDVLLKLAKATHLELDDDQLRKSDSLSTAMHEAVHKANWPAVKKLVEYTNELLKSAHGPRIVRKHKGKLGLWAETQSGWLPIHVAFRYSAPAYSIRAEFIPWLLRAMDDQLVCMGRAIEGGHSGDREGTMPQLPESAVKALGESMRNDEEGKEFLGPMGFDKNRVDTQLFASIVQAEDGQE